MNNKRWVIDRWAQEIGIIPPQEETKKLMPVTTGGEAINLDQIKLTENMAQLALDRFEASIRK